MSRVITNLSLLGIILILWIGAILYRKGLIKEIPPKEDKKYLVIGILIGSTLSAMTFFIHNSLKLLRSLRVVLIISTILWLTFMIVNIKASEIL